MNDLLERTEAYYTLIKSCKNVQDAVKVSDLLDNIERCIQQEGLNNKYGIIESYEAYMNITQYKSIYDLIYNPKDTIIVDVGCGIGLQQVIFSDCYRYIGIDLHEAEKICDNAEIYTGSAEDILPTLKLESYKNVYGISVLCGICFENVAEAMKRRFRKLIII